MDDFTIDWHAQRVTCPMGMQRSGWSPALDNRGTPVIKVKFRHHVALATTRMFMAESCPRTILIADVSAGER